MNNFRESAEFMPYGQCFLWRPDLVWLHTVSDAVIAVAFFAIPLTLFYILRKQQSYFSHRWLFYMFSIFIMCSGLSHLISVLTIWKPFYYLHGLAKAATGSISIATALLFIPLAPRILDFSKSAEKVDDDH